MEIKRQYDECPNCGSNWIEDENYSRFDVGRLVIEVECQDCYFKWQEIWDFAMNKEII